jgi:SAM-dependent methyltransferase
MPLHVRQLESDAAGLDGLHTAVRDARDLDLDDASVDAVLLLGPLYHLRRRADRIRALTEARRVVRPGGPVFAAAAGCRAGYRPCRGAGTRANWNRPTPAGHRDRPLARLVSWPRRGGRAVGAALMAVPGPRLLAIGAFCAGLLAPLLLVLGLVTGILYGLLSRTGLS